MFVWGSDWQPNRVMIGSQTGFERSPLSTHCIHYTYLNKYGVPTLQVKSSRTSNRSVRLPWPISRNLDY